MSNKVIAYALFPWQNDINMEFYVITVYCIGNVLSMMSSLKSHCVFGYKERRRINSKLHTLSCRTTCIILHCCSAFWWFWMLMLDSILGNILILDACDLQTSVYRFDKRLMLIMIWLCVPRSMVIAFHV